MAQFRVYRTEFAIDGTWYDKGFCDGLATAQRRAAEASHKEHQAGNHQAADALAELASDLLIARQGIDT